MRLKIQFPENKSLPFALHYLLLGLLTTSLWLIVVSLLEFLLTEHWYVYNSLNSAHISLLLALIVILVGVIFPKRLSTLSGVFLAVLFAVTLYFHSSYSNYYSYLQHFPKVKSISKNWSIQGDRITILGKNFGDKEKGGSVKVGSLNFMIIHWNNHTIVAEQPVPDSFFTLPMVITNHLDNSVEATESFSITDPDLVL